MSLCPPSQMGQMRRPTQNSSFAANNELAEIHANDPSEYEDLNTESFLADRLVDRLCALCRTRAYFLCGIGLGKPLQKDYMSSLSNLIFCISKKKTRSEALNCARTYLYLAPFASVHMYEAQKLMGLGRSAR
ncbi:hypothetical protein ACET3Z_029651 [Daucus carota]